MAKKKKSAIEETSVTDAVLGKLVFDGFQHHGWAGSFADARFAGWGTFVQEIFPDDEEDDEKDEGPSAESFLSDLMSIAQGKIGDELRTNPEAAKMLEMTRAFAARVDAYDGSLDADKLRRAGRFKVVVRSNKDFPPTDPQRAAWQAFLDGGETLAERIAAALLEVYLAQRPERVRWWKKVWGDSPDTTLPDISTTRQMRALVRPDEFRVYPADEGLVTVAITFTALWADREIKVQLPGGTSVGRIGPAEHDGLINSRASGPVVDSPVFGPLRWIEADDAWGGRFHSDKLRGWSEASELRHNFKVTPGYIHAVYRSQPGWDDVTGDFGVRIAAEGHAPPTPGQEAVWRAFTADTDGHTDGILAAIFDWYQELRPDWIARMNGDPEDNAATMPEVATPADLLDFVSFSGITVLDSTWNNPAACLIFSFGWFDEHGLAVRWRDGRVETIGSHDSAEDD